jgi:hypothetical protein
MAWDPERAFEGTDADEEGTNPPLSCVACGEVTILRCAGCGEPVCERAHACPNGCDAPPRVTPMRGVGEVARALRARLAPSSGE